MPNPIIGIAKQIAIKKAAAWDTAVAAGVGDGVLALSGAMKRTAAVEIDQSRGKSFSVDGTAGPVAVAATYTMNLRYIGLDVCIAMLMGIAGVPLIQGAGPAYLNTYKWSPDVYGLFVTIVESLTAYTNEATTAKITGLTISGEVGAKPLQLAVDIVGSDKKIASAINTLGTFASVTLPAGADANPVMFAQTVFRMNDQSAIALAIGDKIYPSKFTLSLKRKLKGEYTGQYRTVGVNIQDLSDEPTNEDFPELKLTLEFPTHSGTTYLGALGNDTRKKMDITSIGSLLNATFYNQHLWQLPHLQLINDDPTDGKGRINEPLEFLIHGASAAPAGMVGITDPLWWQVINKRTTNPLA